MKKIILGLSIGLMMMSDFSFAKEIKQTICFSQKEVGRTMKVNIASLGDNVTLNGGECKGKTLPQMNKLGWRLIQVVTGLNSSFGMVFELK